MAEIVDMVQTADVADAEQNKVMGILAYLGILFIVPLVAAKDSPFAKYHANQGLVLFLFGLAIGVLWAIPVLNLIVGPIGGLAHIVLAIIGITNAAKGEMKPLPLIGGIKILS